MALRVGLVGAKPLGKEWSEQDGEFIRERGKEIKMVVRQEKRNKNVCRVTFRTNYSNRVICSHFHGGEARLPETGWVRTNVTLVGAHKAAWAKIPEIPVLILKHPEKYPDYIILK